MLSPQQQRARYLVLLFCLVQASSLHVNSLARTCWCRRWNHHQRESWRYRCSVRILRASSCGVSFLLCMSLSLRMPRPIKTTSMRISPPSIVVFTHLSCCSNRAGSNVSSSCPPLSVTWRKTAGSHVACRKPPVAASGSLLAKREDPEVFPYEFSFSRNMLFS